MLEPTTVEELREAIRACEFVIPVGSGTKPALGCVSETWERLSMLRLSGIVEYDPTEFTITVLAGTPLEDIERALGEHGQYLPFDPPLAAAGATIGGTVAAGLSGPGAFRFGPIRDFLIGVRFVDGEGRLITGGGKVVKNAAGFDIPKFLIGSRGRLGVLAELTFKVFPKPEASLTFSIAPRGLNDAVDLIQRLSRSAFDLDALEFDPAAAVVWARITGNREALDARIRKIEKNFPGDRHPITICEAAEADYFWKRQLGFEWADHVLAKVPITPDKIEKLERCPGFECIYSMGGNLAWVSGSDPLTFLAASELKWRLQLLRPSIGPRDSLLQPGVDANARRIYGAVKNAFDPTAKFPPLFGDPSSSVSSEGPSRIDSRPDPDSPNHPTTQ